MKLPSLKITNALVMTGCLIAVAQTRAVETNTGSSFYKEPTLFSTRPAETNSLQTIDRFGPVGLSIDLIQPAFVMRIKDIEKDSPAAATGKLQKGQIIESINGEALKDIDPRIQLGNLITAAESKDGVVALKIKDLAEPVVVKIPVLGSYSKTWPLDCPKSDKIIRGLADTMLRPGASFGKGDIGLWFLISTGDEKDTAAVGEWARKADKPSSYAWFLGFGGVPLCEYYLRTGDEAVLPNIQKWVDAAVAGQYNDAWAGRGGVPAVTYGMGHLNAAGTSVVTFLLLAKECGANVPDHALLGALRHFYRYAGRGGNPYGDGRPEIGFVDNGKNGNLAFAMAAAASLTPEGETSVFAAARDVCAMPSFYTTSFMLHGHTGGGIGEIWRSAAMGLLDDVRPKQYREFMDNRRWHYELSRRFDGSFGILGGAGYDSLEWGVAYGLCYTVPRKTLRITGAPRTKFSKPYQLPKHPWGTAADEEFLSLDAVPGDDGKKQDLTGETLAKDASIPMIGRIHLVDPSDDEALRRLIRHQDATIRQIAAAKILGTNRGYLGSREPGGKWRKELMMECLRSSSARVRQAMFSEIETAIRKDGKKDLLSAEVIDLVIKRIADPQESWWVKDSAMLLLGAGTADQVAPHVNVLLPFLKHDEWWLRNAAMYALTPVAADERCFRTVLPAIGELIRTNQRSAVTLGLIEPIRANIRAASPAVQQLAITTLRESYTGYTGVKKAPGGQDIASTRDSHLEYIAKSLSDMPGGLDVLYEIARAQYPDQILPYKDFFLKADPSQFGPQLKAAITPIINNELIPEFVGKNRAALRKLAALEVQNPRCGGTGDGIDELAALHARAGNAAYDWSMFLDLNQETWSYHTFDPIPAEQVPFDQLTCRYRKVTLPQGMEQWLDPQFDAAKAGWKTGRSPFGSNNRKLPDGPFSKCSPQCVGPICYGATKVHTLWDKEVLLMRGTFRVPPLKEGHRYRLRVNQQAHVGNGNGYGIWINGKRLIEHDQTINRGAGEQPNGAFITKEWLEECNKGEVTFALMSFIRYNDKRDAMPTARIPQGRMSIHLEEQKLPPIGDDLVRKSATVVPMLSSEWQAAQFSESDEEKEAAPLFRWDGKWVNQPALSGSWKVIGEVPAIESFLPAKPVKPKRASFTQLTFQSDGMTSEATMVWSGAHLMDLTRYEALRIEPRTIEGKDYLFLESGGFSTRNQPGWKSPWLVLEKN
jgi:hypothetical protein